MRILLAQNSPYYPAHGGGDKSNRLLVEALAQRGHECRVVARAGSYGPQAHEEYLRELQQRGTGILSAEGGVVSFVLNAVAAHVATGAPNLRAHFAQRVAEFSPDVIIASTDDPAHVLLEVALREGRARVVYLARATLALPFGPDCAFPSEAKTEALRGVDAVVGVSQYVADYIRKWSGIAAVSLPISLQEPGPYPLLGRPDNEFVTLVNPCAVKGISIFLALADRMPSVRFAAVPTWGTNQQDRQALAARPNIELLDPVDQIDKLLARTRVLLVPSLWAEARSRIIVEAMLRGVPVIASAIGGIPEAKMGVDYLIPVRPIAHYRPALDEQMVPVADVPEQDVEPWQRMLERLLADRAHYEELSAASRATAMEYVSSLSIEPFEQLLRQVVARPPGEPVTLVAEPAPRPAASPLEQLSPEKLELLRLRLRRREGSGAATSGQWFASAKSPGTPQLRLFCFPHAGGGASFFASWERSLPAGVRVMPAQLPGREARQREAPLPQMSALVEAVAAALETYLGEPYALFGHSMGAVVGFELARFLRQSRKVLPLWLCVSGARAPQYRLGHVAPPDPPDEAFLEELRRLEGVPQEVLSDPEALRLLLPALKADAALYRRYVYEPGDPLPCPICAYGGLEDPNVRREHLEAWRAQTAAEFRLRMFPGGHFPLRSGREAFLGALAGDLEDLLGRR